MWKPDYRMLLIAAGLLFIVSAGAAPDDPQGPAGEDADLERRIETLEERIASLEHELQLLRQEQQRKRFDRVVPPAPEAPAPTPAPPPGRVVPRLPQQPRIRVVPVPDRYLDRRNWQERRQGALHFYIIPLKDGRADSK